MLNLDLDRAIEACLDPAQMRLHLQPLLAPQGAVEAVRITKAHRSAARGRDPHPLVALYDVQVHDRGEAARRTLRCYGKVCRSGVEAQGAAGTLQVPELGLLLRPWPADAGLPQLAGLLEPQAALPFWGEPARAVDAVRYQPEHRATLRYAGARGEMLYAKTFCDGRGAAVLRRFAWFWERSRQDRRAPRVARPLYYAAGDRTLWQEGVRGTPLREWMAPDRGMAWALPLATAIASVHAAPRELAGPDVHDTAHWLQEATRRRNKIARALPGLAAYADATLAAVEGAARRLPACEPATIHGDFHVDQAWFDGERVVLFDFDEFALGDPMEDLAAFLVRLPADGEPRPAATPWIAAYAQQAPAMFCPVRLAWHLAVQQLLRASRAFVFQVPGWRGEVRRRLAHAQAFALQARAEVAR